MSFAHVKEIIQVYELHEANKLIAQGHELLQIVQGWTADNTPCTLFYLSVPTSEDGPQKARPFLRIFRQRCAAKPAPLWKRPTPCLEKMEPQPGHAGNATTQCKE